MSRTSAYGRYRHAPERLAEVEAALTETGAPLRIVHERVGCWSKETTANVLRELVKQGRAIAVGEMCERTYRRAAAA